MRSSLFLLLCAGLVSAQVPTNATNAADPSNAVLAPGSLIAVGGVNLGPATAVRAEPPYSTTLGPLGIVVRSVATGEESRALMVSVASTRAVAILPSSLSEGEYDLIYLNGTARSRVLRIRVAARSFSLFSLVGDGNGPADARAGEALIGFLAPAKPGQVITLAGTGLGAVPGTDAQGLEQPVTAEIEIRVGKATIKPDYAGRSANFAGVDHLRFVMPSSEEVGEGCYVPVRVKVDGNWSNYLTIAKADTADRCTHPLGLSEAAMKKIDGVQALTLGNFALTSGVLDVDIDGDVALGRIETAQTAFYFGNGNTMLRAAAEAGPVGLPAGECTTLNALLGENDLESIDDLLLPLLVGTTFNPPLALDGGSRALVTSPTGQQALLTPAVTAPNGVLQSILADVDGTEPRALAAGDWQIQWAGGNQLLTGTAKITVKEPDPLSWTQALGVVEAGEELPLNWTLRNLDELQTVFVTGYFLAPSGTSDIAFGNFTCRVGGGATTFTVPASVMQSMPKTPGGGLALLSISGRTAVTPFEARLRQGDTPLDYAAFDQRFAVVKVREYRR